MIILTLIGSFTVREKTVELDQKRERKLLPVRILKLLIASGCLYRLGLKGTAFPSLARCMGMVDGQIAGNKRTHTHIKRKDLILQLPRNEIIQRKRVSFGNRHKDMVLPLPLPRNRVTTRQPDSSSILFRRRVVDHNAVGLQLFKLLPNNIFAFPHPALKSVG